MSEIVDLLDDLKIGDPIMIQFRGACVYGRVSGFSGTEYHDVFSGTEYHDVFPVVHLRTPHGSELFAGRAWIRRITSTEDQEALEKLEADARGLARCDTARCEL